MKTLETRTLKHIEIRSSESDGKRIIEGIIPYNAKSENLGGFREVISPTAFNKTLADGAEVRALFAHDTTKILASTRSGTLKLTNTPDGLLSELDVPNTTYGNDLYEMISRGDCNSMSFGFYPVKQTDSGNIRTLNEVALSEISFGVYSPAYPTTTSVAYKRSLDLILEKRNINIEELTTLLEKEELDEADKTALQNIIGELTKLVPSPTPDSTIEEEKKDEPAADTQPDNSTVAEALESLKLALEMEIENTIQEV